MIAAQRVEPVGEDREDMRMAWLAAWVVQSQCAKEIDVRSLADGILDQFRRWISGDKSAPVVGPADVAAMLGG